MNVTIKKYDQQEKSGGNVIGDNSSNGGKSKKPGVTKPYNFMNSVIYQAYAVIPIRHLNVYDQISPGSRNLNHHKIVV